MTVQRETTTDGARWRSERCTHTLTRLRPGRVHLVIDGYDQGEFGNAIFDELLSEAKNFGKLELFVDLRTAFGAVTPVREAWTEWFRTQAPLLRRVHILSGSRFIDMATMTAKVLSHTGELIVIHQDAASFDAALAR